MSRQGIPPIRGPPAPPAPASAPPSSPHLSPHIDPADMLGWDDVPLSPIPAADLLSEEEVNAKLAMLDNEGDDTHAAIQTSTSSSSMQPERPNMQRERGFGRKPNFRHAPRPPSPFLPSSPDSSANVAITPPSSPVSGISQIPNIVLKSGHLYLNTNYLNWLEVTLPTNIRRLKNEETPVIPSPYTVDVPLIAATPIVFSTSVGDGLARVFGEREGMPMQNPCRDRMMRFCRFGALLLLARMNLSMRRGEPQRHWRHKLEVSIRQVTAHQIFGPFGVTKAMTEGKREYAMSRIIDRVVEVARTFPGVSFRNKHLNAHPDIVRYLDRWNTPSLPNMHIKLEGTYKILLDGNKASSTVVLASLQPRLHDLKVRLLHQGTVEHMEAVLLGTWPRPELAVIVAAFTSNTNEKPAAYDGKNFKADRLAKMIICCVLRPSHLPINVPKSELFTERDLLALPTNVMADHATYVVRMAQGCVRRSFRLERRGKDVVIPKNKEMKRELDETLDKQNNECNLCFAGFTFFMRHKRRFWDDDDGSGTEDEGESDTESCSSVDFAELSYEPEEAEAAAAAREEGSREEVVEQGEDEEGVEEEEGREEEEGVEEEEEREEEEGELGDLDAEMGDARIAQLGDNAATSAASSSSASAAAPPATSSTAAAALPAASPTAGAARPTSPSASATAARRPAAAPGAVGGGTTNTLAQKEAWQKQPSNASADQIVPGKGYPGNLQCLCVACQDLKWIWSMDDARVYIWHIDTQWHANAKYRRVTINDDGTRTLWADVEAYNRDHKVQPADEAELAFIRKLAHARFVDVDKRGHQVDLTEQQVLDGIFLKNRCGKGVIMTPEAIIIPMPLASIDRKKPWIGYTLLNCRPVESGDNRTRGIAHHDEARIWWHEHIKSKKVAKAGKAAKRRGGRIPTSNWLGEPIDRWLNTSVTDVDDLLGCESSGGRASTRRRSGRLPGAARTGAGVSGGRVRASTSRGAESRGDDFALQELRMMVEEEEDASEGEEEEEVQAVDLGGDHGVGEDSDYEFGGAETKVASETHEVAEKFDQDIRAQLERTVPTNLLAPRRAFPTMRRWVSVGDMVNVTAGKEAVEGTEEDPKKPTSHGIKGDGSCLIRAVAQVAGWGHRRLRAALRWELQVDEAEWKAELEEPIRAMYGVSFEQWRKKQGKDKAWGDAFTLRPLRRVVGKPIVAVSDGASGRYVTYADDRDEGQVSEPWVGVWLLRDVVHWESMW